MIARTDHKTLTILMFLALLGANGCQKDEAPPPLPEPKPTAAPSVVPLELAPEEEEEEDTPKTGGGKAGPSGLQKCCNALAQNAKNAPPPTDAYMNTAAQLCNGAVASGQAKVSVVGAIRAALKGAGMPAECQ